MDVEVIVEPGTPGLDDVRALVDAASAHDGHRALGEHKWLDLVHGGRRDFAGVVAREDGGPLVGYAHLSRHTGDEAQWGLEIVVHPDRRGGAVEEALVEAALGVAEQQGGGHLHLWVFQPSDVHDRLASRLGLERGRDLLHMRMPLPPEEPADMPPGFELRTFEPGRDEEAWLEVNNRAFRHHPEQGAWDRETLERRMSEDWFDPEGFLVATDDGGLAGFCWTKVEPGGDEGEIYVIGVDPSRQGTGLGKALVLAGLHSMAERGVRTGTLYVDAANEAAVNLYRDLGFDVHHRDRAYVKDV